jgi:hypothetical protein
MLLVAATYLTCPPMYHKLKAVCDYKDDKQRVRLTKIPLYVIDKKVGTVF